MAAMNTWFFVCVKTLSLFTLVSLSLAFESLDFFGSGIRETSVKSLTVQPQVDLLLSASNAVRKKRSINDLLQQRSRRSAGSCIVTDYTKELQKDTKTNVYNDTNYSLILVWTGKDNETMLMLTTMDLGIFVGTSKLWISDSFGKEFIDISNNIDNAIIRKSNGIMQSPINHNRIILVSYNMNPYAKKTVIYVTKTGNEKFDKYILNFRISGPITFHASDPDLLLARDIQYSLWVSQNFGKDWTLVHKYVREYRWGTNSHFDKATTIYFTVDPSKMKAIKYDFILMKSHDFGKSTETLKEHVYSFGTQEKFLFASAELDKKNDSRAIGVSRDGGKKWNKAQLPSITSKEFYSVLDMSEGMIFMHVDKKGDSGYGTLYTSGADGIIYSESLQRHLYPNYEAVTDFYRVLSMRGVYLANQLQEDNSIRTMVTYDRGAVWQTVPIPHGLQCKDKKKPCSLHLHNKYSRTKGVRVPMGPLSVPNAVGIILAHGHVADALQTTSPDVFVSTDGGYSWMLALKGPHYYAITDHGGLLVAVPADKETTNLIKFSYDEGQCWNSYKFTSKPIKITSLLTKPGSKSLHVSLWGFDMTTHRWSVITIDFGSLLTQTCQPQAFESWVPHETNHNGGCLLGLKETFKRISKNKMCKHGPNFDYLASKTKEFCDCTVDDYECDFGYYRNENDKCVLDTNIKAEEFDVCINGELEKLETPGYRKIPGDQCTGGFTPSEKELRIDLKSKCSELAYSSSNGSRGKKAGKVFLALFLIVILLTLLVGIGYYIKKKRICFRKSKLSYKYSTLKGAGDDELVNSIMDNNVDVYHDDSDEDILD